MILKKNARITWEAKEERKGCNMTQLTQEQYLPVLMKMVNKKSTKPFAQVIKLDETGRAIVTDGFKMLIYHNSDITENRTIDSIGLDVEVNYPNWSGVLPTEGSEYETYSENYINFVSSFLSSIKKLSGKPEDMPVIYMHGNISIIPLSKVERYLGVAINPYLIAEYSQKMPKEYKLTEIKSYNEKGFAILKWANELNTDYFEIMVAGILPSHI